MDRPSTRPRATHIEIIINIKKNKLIKHKKLTHPKQNRGTTQLEAHNASRHITTHTNTLLRSAQSTLQGTHTTVERTAKKRGSAPKSTHHDILRHTPQHIEIQQNTQNTKTQVSAQQSTPHQPQHTSNHTHDIPRQTPPRINHDNHDKHHRINHNTLITRTRRARIYAGA